MNRYQVMFFTNVIIFNGEEHMQQCFGKVYELPNENKISIAGHVMGDIKNMDFIESDQSHYYRISTITDFSFKQLEAGA